MEFLVLGLTIVVGVLPLAATALLALYFRSWRRWAAVALLVLTGGVFALEIYSASVGGSLTGLVWILSTPAVVIALLVLILLERITRRQSSEAPIRQG
jgi:uncharacterized membrane protein